MKKVVLIIVSLILVCVLGVLIFAVCFKDGKIDIENTTTTNIESTENIEVVDENVIKDVIPDGAIYKRGNIEYKSGEKIPTAEVGDILIYKGYEYQYCKEKLDDIAWVENLHMSGWGVCALKGDVETYPNVLTSINGINIVSARELFGGCDNLKYLSDDFKLPETVKDLSFAFRDCSNLERLPKNFRLPKDTTSIDYIFSGCSKIETIPETFVLENIENARYIFADCTSLKTLPENFTIPEGVMSIEGIFKGCINLEKIPGQMIIPNTVDNVDKAFQGCKKIEFVCGIPESVKTMNNTFDGCEKLSPTLFVEATPIEYENCLNGTNVDEIVGNCKNKKDILLTANN